MKIDYKSIGLTILIGAASALGFAPFSFPPALIASYAWLFRQIGQQDNAGKSFRTAYWWALGHYVAGLYWIGNSTLIDYKTWWWVWPLATFALPAAFSLYQAVTAWLVVRLSRFGLNKTALMAALFPLAELARAYWFSGFPWNMAGVTWISIPWIAQNADYMGMFGLSAVTILCAAAIANYREKSGLIAVTAMLFVMTVYGIIVRQPTVTGTDTHVRIVQPNIPQQFKWDREHIIGNSVSPLQASDAPPAPPAAHNMIIWPETAQANEIWQNPDFNRLFRATFRDWPKDTIIYSGVLKTDPGNMGNLVVASDRDGAFLWSQNKHHLVPYGEYMPYDDIIKLGPIVGMEGFIRGPEPSTMKDGIIPLICYEIIFPDLARHATDSKSRSIITVTDDSWFGTSSGPYQHLAQARFRAIETGLPVLRSANTGISAVIDPYGRVLQRSILNNYAIIDEYLPVKRKTLTFYKIYGHLFLYFYFGLSLLTLLLGVRRTFFH